MCGYFNETRRADGDNSVRVDADNCSDVNDSSTSCREQLCINTLRPSIDLRRSSIRWLVIEAHSRGSNLPIMASNDFFGWEFFKHFIDLMHLPLSDYRLLFTAWEFSMLAEIGMFQSGNLRILEKIILFDFHKTFLAKNKPLLFPEVDPFF